MKAFKCMLVCGTRPEILKIAPVVNELKKRNIEYNILFTNQHFSSEMGKNFFNEFGIKINYLYKKIFSHDLVTTWIKNKIKDLKPDVVLVVGDTTSALLGAMASAFTNTKIGHIESGLRSFDFEEPFPEEYNRCLIDSISTFHFCPTTNNFENILNKQNKQIHITGNTIIDLVSSMNLVPTDSRDIIITSHRRENWKRIEDICKGLIILSEKLPKYNFIFVKHANKELATKIERYLEKSSIRIVPPQSYKDFLTLIAHSHLILSDSGGIVEEASFLGKPVGILRKKTERPEAIYSGHAQIIGTEEDLWKNALAFIKYRESHKPDKCPFGDGNASERIVDILEDNI